jgi:N-acetylmuramoyl-L-alanine amidase
MRQGLGQGVCLVQLRVAPAAVGAAAFMQTGLAQAATVLAVRLWPANDYTRVTIELDEAIQFSHRVVENPHRLVVDLAGIALDQPLRELVAKVRADDPFIDAVRVGQYSPTVVRLVFDLKTAVDPQLFKIAPIAQFRYRLVFDLHPTLAADPLAALLKKMQSGPAQPNDPIGQILEQAQAKDNPAASTPNVPATPGVASPTPAAPKPTQRAGPVVRLVTVVLDPGHGGEDPGAIGAAGTREKDVVLAMAKKLRARLIQLPNVRVLLTRDEDVFIPLAQRVATARAVNADVFISIHADAFERRSARGASVYILSEKGASSTAARWLANKENRADQIGGASLMHRNREVASMLMALSTAAQIKDSAVLGKAVLAGLGDVGRLHKSDIEQAGFAVLKAPDIPSILVETAFISNPEEEKKLASQAYQQQVAEAIFKGIQRYLRASGLRSKS